MPRHVRCRVPSELAPTVPRHLRCGRQRWSDNGPPHQCRSTVSRPWRRLLSSDRKRGRWSRGCAGGNDGGAGTAVVAPSPSDGAFGSRRSRVSARTRVLPTRCRPPDPPQPLPPPNLALGVPQARTTSTVGVVMPDVGRGPCGVAGRRLVASSADTHRVPTSGRALSRSRPDVDRRWQHFASQYRLGTEAVRQASGGASASYPSRDLGSPPLRNTTGTRSGRPLWWARPDAAAARNGMRRTVVPDSDHAGHPARLPQDVSRTSGAVAAVFQATFLRRGPANHSHHRAGGHGNVAHKSASIAEPATSRDASTSDALCRRPTEVVSRAPPHVGGAGRMCRATVVPAASHPPWSPRREAPGSWRSGSHGRPFHVKRCPWSTSTATTRRTRARQPWVSAVREGCQGVAHGGLDML